MIQISSFNIPSDVHSFLFHAVTGSKAEEIIHSRVLHAAALLELRRYSDLSRHIKDLQNSIYCLDFIIKLTEFENCFILKVTKHKVSAIDWIEGTLQSFVHSSTENSMD